MSKRLRHADLVVVQAPASRESELEAGRIDVFMSDYPFTRMIDNHDWVKIIDPPGAYFPGRLRLRAQKGDPAWLARLDAFLARTRADGTLRSIATRYASTRSSSTPATAAMKTSNSRPEVTQPEASTPDAGSLAQAMSLVLLIFSVLSFSPPFTTRTGCVSRTFANHRTIAEGLARVSEREITQTLQNDRLLERHADQWVDTADSGDAGFDALTGSRPGRSSVGPHTRDRLRLGPRHRGGLDRGCDRPHLAGQAPPNSKLRPARPGCDLTRLARPRPPDGVPCRRASTRPAVRFLHLRSPLPGVGRRTLCRRHDQRFLRHLSERHRRPTGICGRTLPLRRHLLLSTPAAGRHARLERSRIRSSAPCCRTKEIGC